MVNLSIILRHCTFSPCGNGMLLYNANFMRISPERINIPVQMPLSLWTSAYGSQITVDLLYLLAKKRMSPNAIIRKLRCIQKSMYSQHWTTKKRISFVCEHGLNIITQISHGFLCSRGRAFQRPYSKITCQAQTEIKNWKQIQN